MEFFQSLYQYGDVGMLLLRLTVGIIFIKHGMMKIAMWKMQPSEQMPAQMLNLMRGLSIVESVAGLAMIIGLFTQLVAVVLGIVMLGAMYYKIFKWGKKFTGDGGWEFDLILLVASLALVLSNGGKWALDALLLQ